MKYEMSKFECVWNVSKIGLVLKFLMPGVQNIKKFQKRVYSLKDMVDLNCLRRNKVYEFALHVEWKERFACVPSLRKCVLWAH